MSEKTCNIAVQYLRAVYATTHLRPYQNKSPIHADIQVTIQEEPLPEAGHHRVELSVCVVGSNAEGILCYETGAHYEAIVVHKNLTSEELDSMVRVHVPGLLLANVRASLANSMAQTGYTSSPLPPLTGAQLRQLAERTATPAQATATPERDEKTLEDGSE